MSEPFLDERIITRALSDATFRTELAANAQQALAKAGYVVTQNQLDAIVQARPAEWVNYTLHDIASRIDAYARKKGYP